MASIVDPDPDSKTEPPECTTCGKRQWPVLHSCTGVRQPRRSDQDDLSPAMRELADGLAQYLDSYMREVASDELGPLDVDYQYLAEDFVESCVVDIMHVDDCGHHSWAGLMALLDEHWPDDIFPTRYQDDPKRDAGARIVSLMRWVDQLQARELRVEAVAERFADLADDTECRVEDDDDSHYRSDQLGLAMGYRRAALAIRRALDGGDA